LEFAEADTARALAVKLIEAANLMDAMTGNVNA